MSECDESSENFTSEVEEVVPNDTTRLWNKRDYFYKINKNTEEKIIKNFELKINNPLIETEDAFYSSTVTIPITEITSFREDPYILERLECKKLRELNLEFLELTRINYIQIQKYIEDYKVCTDGDTKLIIKSIVKQKKKLDVLYNSLRNKIAEIILKAEDCYIFMDSIWSAVFRKSLELATTEVSSHDCN